MLGTSFSPNKFVIFERILNFQWFSSFPFAKIRYTTIVLNNPSPVWDKMKSQFLPENSEIFERTINFDNARVPDFDCKDPCHAVISILEYFQQISRVIKLQIPKRTLWFSRESWIFDDFWVFHLQSFLLC